MIFDTNYDNLLWYILKTDKQNREIILDIIRSMPQDFNNEIKKAISKYRECQITKKEYDEIKKAIKLNDCSICGFKLLKNGTLQLMKATLDSKNDVEKRTIDLSTTNKIYNFDEDMLAIPYFGQLTITTIEKDPWNPKGYEVESITDYGIINAISGKYIIKEQSDKTGFRDKTKRINIKNIPTDICVNSLDIFNSKKLSKTKRRVC